MLEGARAFATDALDPTITPFAVIHERDAIFARQDNQETCGYYSLRDGVRILAAAQRFGQRAASDGDDITAYDCANFSGEYTLRELAVVTYSASSGGDSSGNIISTISSIQTSGGLEDEYTLTRQTSTAIVPTSSASPEPENTSEPPVGAIVGGVLGGLALIAAIGFGLWFIRYKARKNPQGPSSGPMMGYQPQHQPQPQFQPEPVPYYQQQPVMQGNSPQIDTPYSEPSVFVGSQVEAKTLSISPHQTSQPILELPSIFCVNSMVVIHNTGGGGDPSVNQLSPGTTAFAAIDEQFSTSACITGLKSDGRGGEITAYGCVGYSSNTDVSIHSSKPETTGEEPSETTSQETSTRETTTATNSASPPDSDSDDSSGPPVGAIVGGVLGGLALLVFIGFILWFIRHKKQQTPKSPNNPPTMAYQPEAQAEPVSYYQQQPIAYTSSPQASAGFEQQAEAKSPSISPSPTSRRVSELPTLKPPSELP
ncbi:hypothetical protein F66182_3487 [Fusarium sp. NRRL 66182]|nr:hypothetical protein F66182_3487 [Fusarium sp. NRRL 66182]